MARAIGSGTHFFGLPAKEGRVLYIEVDTPEQLIAARLKSFPPAPNVWWEFMEPLSIPNVTPEQESLLRTAQKDICPDVVFINTLRKVHDLDDKDSRAPKLVYSYFRHVFPASALFFVHHMRKSPVDPKALTHQKEGFSGANNWLNDAQTGLHLESYTGEKQNLSLFHVKSQVTQILRPLPLFLDTAHDAALSSPLYDEMLVTYELLNASIIDGIGPAEIDRLVGTRLGISESTAKKRRLLIEANRFPGSRLFLA